MNTAQRMAKMDSLFKDNKVERGFCPEMLEGALAPNNI